MLNDAVIPISGLGDCGSDTDGAKWGMCKLGTFVEGLKTRVAEIDFNQACFANYTYEVPSNGGGVTNGRLIWCESLERRVKATQVGYAQSNEGIWDGVGTCAGPLMFEPEWLTHRSIILLKRPLSTVVITLCVYALIPSTTLVIIRPWILMMDGNERCSMFSCLYMTWCFFMFSFVVFFWQANVQEGLDVG